MKKVAILHTDFRIYWPARIQALQLLLQSKGIELYTIEIAGKGSPYAFAEKNNERSIKNWQILFPERDIESLSGKEIEKQLFPILSQLNPEVVIAGAIAFPSGALAVNWCKRHKKKVIIFDDARVEDVPRNCMTNFIKNCIYKNVDAMLYPAPAWETTGLYWGFLPKQLFYGVDVVDNSFWQPDRAVSKENYFICVGRLIDIKNYLFIIKAYQHLKEKQNKLPDLWIVGDGPEKDTILSFIQSNKIEGIKVLPFQSQSELIALFQKAQAMIIGSKSETWGLVINEAMASGIPVIASQHCGATSSLLQEGVNGYTFNPFEIESLVNKWEVFLNLTEEERRHMGRKSSEIIKDWDLDRFANVTFESISYVMSTQYRHPNLIESFIINFWKGRYNPI